MDTDQPRPVATGDDSRHTLTIEAVAHRYADAGHPRTIRTLQRYCASGHIDCLKAPTKLGDMYLATPESVARHIAELDEVEATTRAAVGRGETRSVATVDAGEDHEAGTQSSPATNDDRSRPDATVSPDASRYVVRLEGEVDFLRGQVATKDEQIKELTGRASETNHLIAGLQRMLTPLLGSGEGRQSRTYDDRSVDGEAA